MTLILAISSQGIVHWELLQGSANRKSFAAFLDNLAPFPCHRVVLMDNVGFHAILVYGASHVSPSGIGNLSVPTSGVYNRACLRFKRTTLCDETGTSQSCPCCGRQAHAVLECARSAPTVRMRVAVADLAVRLKVLHSNHAGGDRVALSLYPERVGVTLQRANVLIEGHRGESAAVRRRKAARRPEGVRAREVRGLRFCPDCSKLLDRDDMAADGIGMCFVKELAGEPRPPQYTHAGLAVRRAHREAARRLAEQRRRAARRRAALAGGRVESDDNAETAGD